MLSMRSVNSHLPWRIRYRETEHSRKPTGENANIIHSARPGTTQTILGSPPTSVVRTGLGKRLANGVALKRHYQRGSEGTAENYHSVSASKGTETRSTRPSTPTYDRTVWEYFRMGPVVTLGNRRLDDLLAR